MELRTINTFLHIAELHSFSRAARELGYSQSAVSSHIAQLEAELGTPLFDRCLLYTSWKKASPICPSPKWRSWRRRWRPLPPLCWGWTRPAPGGAAMLFIILFHVALPREDAFFGLRRMGNVGVDVYKSQVDGQRVATHI